MIRVAQLLLVVAAVLLMRSAVVAHAAKYVAPGASGTAASEVLSERGMWDALDEGADPTVSRSDLEGR